MGGRLASRPVHSRAAIYHRAALIDARCFFDDAFYAPALLLGDLDDISDDVPQDT